MADGDYEHRDRRIAELKRIAAFIEKTRKSKMQDCNIPERDVKEWTELVSFETIGADPAHLRDTVQCAMWLKTWLAKLGFSCELLASEKVKGAPPVVFAEREGDETMPSILFYGHYDVQSPEPLDEWQTPPFSLTLKSDGRYYGRGSNDDKGQFFAFLCGVRELIESGEKLPTLKILLEGQEESGSAALTALAPEIRRKIAANMLVVCDTNATETKDGAIAGAIVAGLRGVAHFEICLEGPSCDLHSGEYGGGAPNTAQIMAELVSSLHDAKGRVAVEGFYDGIVPPSAREEEAAGQSTPSPEAFAKATGVPPCGGEKGVSLARRLAFEPTLEINGIHSGWGGAGAKTIIPAKAVAKISMRLVPGQNPRRTIEAVKRHLQERVPEGVKFTFEGGGEAAAGFRLPLDSPAFRLAEDLLERVTGNKTLFVWEGASIPVVSELVHQTGAAPLIVGFGLPQDRIHAPNESYSARQFLLAKAWAKEIIR